MDAHDVYRRFSALKRHFTSGSTYSYQRYQGRITTLKVDDFKMKSDRVYYEKLLKKDDILNRMIGNLHTHPKLWIGELLSTEGEARYSAYRSRVDSISYTLRNELPSVDTVEELLDDSSGHSILVKEWLGGRLSVVSLSVLDSVLNFTPAWAKSRDSIVRECRERTMRLRPFLVYDGARVTEILTNKFSWSDPMSR